MKKTALAAAVAVAVGTSALSTAQANTAGLTGVWTGTYTFTMFSPGGDPVGAATPPQAWTWDFDNGSVTIQNTTAFYGFVWTANSVTFSDTGTSYDGSMLFAWNVNPTIAVTSSWDVTATGSNAVVTVNSAQITPDASAFAFFQPHFSGNITQQVSAIPVPAAAWLMGSGLLGLVGVARRRRRS